MERFLISDSSCYPVSEEKITAQEKKLGYAFPAKLRAYYLTHNGQQIRECSFRREGRLFTVSSILPLFEYSMSAVRTKELLSNSSKLPASYFPFALNEDGDNYFIDLLSGKIFLIPTDSLGRHIPAADSIDEFFTMMESHVEPACPSGDSFVQKDSWTVSQNGRVRRTEKAAFFPLSRRKKNT